MIYPLWVAKHLSEDEKSLIIQNTAKGVPVEAVAKKLGRHQRTIRRFSVDFLSEEEEVRYGFQN